MTEPPRALRLGIDVGGTRLKLALIADVGTPGATIITRRVVSLSPADRSAHGLVACLSDNVAALKSQRHGAIGGVGLGVAGIVDAATGCVLDSPNLPWLSGVNLGSALADALELPVRVDNDVNCIGWGEATAGAGAGVSDQVCLALGTGVGGGLVLDGGLVRGQRGRGAELGHLCIDRRGPPCGCGSRGCLEQYASQTGLWRMMSEYGLIPPGRMPVPADVVDLFALAAGGHGQARAIVHRAGQALGQAIAAYLHVFDMPLVVISGGIAAALEDLRPAIAAGLARHAPRRLTHDLQIVAGRLAEDAGCIGAAWLR